MTCTIIDPHNSDEFENATVHLIFFSKPYEDGRSAFVFCEAVIMSPLDPDESIPQREERALEEFMRYREGVYALHHGGTFPLSALYPHLPSLDLRALAIEEKEEEIRQLRADFAANLAHLEEELSSLQAITHNPEEF